MFSKLVVANERGGELTLSLRDVSEGFIIEDITGLDPVKASIVSSGYAQIDGAQFQASRRDVRNIMLRLGLSPDYATDTVTSLRQRLYSFFMPKEKLRLQFFMDTGMTLTSEVTVESFNTDHFTKTPSATISMIDFNPDFYEDLMVVVPGMTSEDGATNMVEINYTGSTKTGFLFNLVPNHDIAAFTIYNTPSSDTTESLEFITPLTLSREIEMDTENGYKGAWLTDTWDSVMYGVAPYAEWVNLYPGINQIRVLAEGVPMPWRISYRRKFGGL